MPLAFSHVAVLRDWMANDDSSIINLEARGMRTSSRDLSADLLKALLEAEIPVAWILPGSIDDEDSTMEQLFASLILQIIKVNPTVLSDQAHRISVAHFKGEHSMDDWFSLLGRCLKGVKKIFLVLDLVFIRKVLQRDHSMQIDVFIQKLEDICQTQQGVLKIIILTWRSDTAYNAILEALPDGVVIGTDPGARKVRLFRNPKFRAAHNARMRNSSHSFGWISELS